MDFKDYWLQRNNHCRRSSLTLTRRLFTADSLSGIHFDRLSYHLHVKSRCTAEYLFVNEIGRQVGWIGQGWTGRSTCTRDTYQFAGSAVGKPTGIRAGGIYSLPDVCDKCTPYMIPGFSLFPREPWPRDVVSAYRLDKTCRGYLRFDPFSTAYKVRNIPPVQSDLFQS